MTWKRKSSAAMPLGGAARGPAPFYASLPTTRRTPADRAADCAASPVLPVTPRGDVPFSTFLFAFVVPSQLVRRRTHAERRGTSSVRFFAPPAGVRMLLFA